MCTPMVYEIRIEGHIGDSWSPWFEGLSLRHEENGETVLSGHIADQAALHGILMRIRDMGLPLVSVNRIEGFESWYTYTDKSSTIGGGKSMETREQVVEFIKEVKFAYLATLGTDNVPRVRPLAACNVHQDSVYFFTFKTTRKVAEMAGHPQAELAWARLQDYAQVRMRGPVALEEDPDVQAHFKAENPMVAQLLPPGAEHLFALYKLTPDTVEAVVGLKPYTPVTW